MLKIRKLLFRHIAPHIRISNFFVGSTQWLRNRRTRLREIQVSRYHDIRIRWRNIYSGMVHFIDHFPAWFRIKFNCASLTLHVLMLFDTILGIWNSLSPTHFFHTYKFNYFNFCELFCLLTYFEFCCFWMISFPCTHRRSLFQKSFQGTQKWSYDRFDSLQVKIKKIIVVRWNTIQNDRRLCYFLTYLRVF